MFLRRSFIIVVMLIGIAATHRVHGANVGSGGRVIAVVHNFSANEEAWIDVSEDGRTLYVMLDERHQTGRGPTRFDHSRLEIFDISQPRTPRRISELRLDQVATGGFLVRGGRLFFLHGGDERFGLVPGLTIIDVHSPLAPMVASNTSIAGFRLDVDRDGSLAQIRTLTGGYVRFRISRSGAPEPTDASSKDLTPTELFRRPAIKGTRGEALELLDGRAITADLSTIYLWNVETQPPRMTASIGLGAQPLDARFLAAPTVLAVLNTRGVELISSAPSPYDPARLRMEHRLLLTQYNQAVARRGGKVENPLAATNHYSQLGAALWDAGVTWLMSEMGDGMPHATRAQILNDYGFWLSRAEEPLEAVPVLTKAVEIDPGRAVAYLNLADAALASLPMAVTWQQKLELSKTVVKAHAAYQHLTGKTLPDAASFAEFNVAVAANDDVCDYVAGFYNRGRQAEMFGFPDPVDIAGDGVPRHVYIYHDGTAEFAGIVASTNPLNYDEIHSGSPKGEVDLFMPDDAKSPTFMSEPHVFPFQRGYYVLYADHGPIVVYSPNRGAVCRFTPHYRPILVENHDSEICAGALATQSFERVPTRKLAPGEAVQGAEGLGRPGGPARFFAEADVGLGSQNVTTRVGYFGISSGAGRGCDMSGVAILDHDRIEVSPRSHALIAAENQVLKCEDSEAFLIRVNGHTLIEMDGGQWRGNGIVERSLFRLLDDKIEPVCRVQQHATYEAQQVQDGRSPSNP